MTSVFTSINALIEGRQAQLTITDAELSHALGYKSERVMALIRDGSMRIPLDKVAVLASVLEVDARHVLQLVLAESSPLLYAVLEQVFNPLKLAQHEVGLIKHCRKLSGSHLTAFIVVGGERELQ